jgi:hypothetical protein
MTRGRPLARWQRSSFGWCWFGCLALRCGPSVTAPATTSLVRLNELRCNPRDEPQPAKGRYRYRHQINDIREPRPARRSIWSVTGLKYSHDLFRSASTNMFPTVVAEYRFVPHRKVSSEQSRRAEYDRLKALPRWAGLGEIARHGSE